MRNKNQLQRNKYWFDDVRNEQKQHKFPYEFLVRLTFCFFLYRITFVCRLSSFSFVDFATKKRRSRRKKCNKNPKLEVPQMMCSWFDFILVNKCVRAQFEYWFNLSFLRDRYKTRAIDSVALFIFLLIFFIRSSQSFAAFECFTCILTSVVTV